jgi:hypothetical protein
MGGPALARRRLGLRGQPELARKLVGPAPGDRRRSARDLVETCLPRWASGVFVNEGAVGSMLTSMTGSMEDPANVNVE